MCVFLLSVNIPACLNACVSTSMYCLCAHIYIYVCVCLGMNVCHAMQRWASGAVSPEHVLVSQEDLQHSPQLCVDTSALFLPLETVLSDVLLVSALQEDKVVFLVFFCAPSFDLLLPLVSLSAGVGWAVGSGLLLLIAFPTAVVCRRLCSGKRRSL